MFYIYFRDLILKEYYFYVWWSVSDCRNHWWLLSSFRAQWWSVNCYKNSGDQWYIVRYVIKYDHLIIQGLYSCRFHSVRFPERLHRVGFRNSIHNLRNKGYNSIKGSWLNVLLALPAVIQCYWSFKRSLAELFTLENVMAVDEMKSSFLCHRTTFIEMFK